MMRLHAGDILAAKENVSGCGLNLACEQLEEGALARAVWSDHTAQLRFREREIHIAGRVHATETHVQIAGLEQRCHWEVSLCESIASVLGSISFDALCSLCWSATTGR